MFFPTTGLKEFPQQSSLFEQGASRVFGTNKSLAVWSDGSLWYSSVLWACIETRQWNCKPILYSRKNVL